MNPIEWLLLIGLSILWGGSFYFVEVCLEELPPLTIVFLRVGLAALALQLVLRIVHRSRAITPALWRDFFVMGVLNNCIPFTLIVWGQSHIASGLAAILNATTPLFTIVLAQLLTQDEQITPARLMGVAFGFTGVVIMIGQDLLGGFDAHVGGQLAILGAACSYGFASIFGKRFRGVPPITSATGQLTASSLLLLPVVMAVDHPLQLHTPGLTVWNAVIGLALMSTALAYIIFFRILSTAGAVNLMLVTFLVPVSAILLGAAFLGETIETIQLIGMSFIGLGLLSIDGRLEKLIRMRLRQKG